MSSEIEISDEPAQNHFKHHPLPDPATYIRLLEILEGQFDTHVICEVSEWPVDEAPAYYAISYTWGDPEATTEITVNGKRMTVRQNCEYVLQQAFASKRSRYFWVDAICIDQQSTNEKNHQVAMMGQIYKRAVHVFSCVGPHDDDTHFLVDFLVKREELVREVTRGIDWQKLLNLSRMRYQMNDAIASQRKLSLRLILNQDTNSRKRLTVSFLNFMKRIYFTRVWILQELYQAAEVSFCCGSDIYPLRFIVVIGALTSFWRYGRRDLMGHIRTIRAIRRGFWKSPGQPESFEDVQTQMACLLLGCGSKEPFMLRDVMAFIRQFDCADARDRFFGIISLVDWNAYAMGAPVPDYTQDRFEVAKIALNYIGSHWMGYITMSMYEAFSILEAFGVTPEVASARKAIEARHNTKSSNDPETSISDEAVTLSMERSWCGRQIYGPRERVAAQDLASLDYPLFLQDLDSARDRPFLNLSDDRGRVMAYVHSSTRPGDLILYDLAPPDVFGGGASSGLGGFDLPVPQHYLYLLIRPDGADRYHIVGTALGSRQFRKAASSLNFSITWQVEDLLVFAWHCAHGAPKEATKAQIADFLDFRVCDSSRSSYAQQAPEKQSPWF